MDVCCQSRVCQTVAAAKYLRYDKHFSQDTRVKVLAIYLNNNLHFTVVLWLGTCDVNKLGMHFDSGPRAESETHHI